MTEPDPASIERATLTDLTPASPTLRSWLGTVTRVARQRWKPALLVTGVPVAGSLAVVELARGLAGWAAAANTGDGVLGALSGTDPSALAVGVGIPAALALLVITIASIGWAGGIWAVVGPASTGRAVTVGDGYRVGVANAHLVAPWALVAGLVLLTGLAAFLAPGIYVLFALSLFSFVALFEPRSNPLRASITLTHRQWRRAIIRWAILLIVVVAFETVLSAVFAALSLALVGRTGLGTDAHQLADTLIDAVHTAVGAPVWAFLMIGLTVTYLDLTTPERTRKAVDP